MAQTKTIQLLRSSSVAASLEAAKTAIQTAGGTRKDGELLLGRYWSGTGSSAVIKSVIGIYHANPDLTPAEGETITAGWTFIQDITSSSEGLKQLQDEVDAIETALGIDGDGTWDGYPSGSDIVGQQTTITGTVDQIIEYIKTLDLAQTGGNSGDVITTVSQADGQVSATASSLTDVLMTGYSKTNDTGAIAATDTLEQAFSKVENTIAAATVKSTDKTVTITDNSGKDLSVNIDGTTLIKNTTSGVISSDLKILKETTGLDTNVKEQYKLVYGSSTTAIGDVIKVYKDSSLKSVALNGQKLDFTYILADGTESTVSVDVSTFLAESEFKDGLQVNNGEVSVKIGDGIEYGSETSGNKSIKVKIDTESSGAENFLSVGANGVKISGVQNAIDTAIADLDVTDTAVAGQYVSAVNETDGKVSMTRANVSEAVLNNYAKGTKPVSLDIAATDTINQAFNKLEHKIADGVASLDADVTSANGVNVQVQVVETDGKITAVNVTDRSINASDLNNKIADLDGKAIATAGKGNVYTVLTGVTETDGIISKTGEVTLAAVAKTGAAADVSITDSDLLKATNVEKALQEIATNVSNNALVSNDVIVVTPDTANNNTKLSVTIGNGLEKTGTNNEMLSVKQGDGITVNANGVAVNLGLGLEINSTSKAVDIKIDPASAKLGIDPASAKLGDDSNGMLTVSSNGLKLSDTWDCGVF